MTRARTRLLALSTFVWIATSTAPVAHAWTEASVRSAAAEVDVAPDGSATVHLALRVRVSAGWLEGFEVAGLDPDLVLSDGIPPVFRSESGEPLRARVEDQGEGRVTFAFRRRDAPRRGEYRAELTYTTQLAHRSTELAPTGRVRVRWTLPGWRSGLDTPSIVLTVPEGSELVAEGEETSGLDVQQSEIDGRTRFVLRRVHLPRTREWTVAVDVPQDAMHPSVTQLPEADPTEEEPSVDEASSVLSPASVSVPAQPPAEAASPLAAIAAEPESSTPLAYLLLALLAASLLALRAWRIERAEHAARVECAAWVPMKFQTRLGGIVCLGAGAAASAATLGPAAADALLVLAALLVLRKRSQSPRAARLGTFRPTTLQVQRAARRAVWLERLDPSDGSTVPGMFVVATSIAAPITLALLGQLPVALHHALIVSSLVVLTMLRGTRTSRPLGPLAALHTLLGWASRQRTLAARPIALRPMVHVGVRQDLQEARMRVVLDSMPKGLLRLDVTLGFGANHDHWDVAPLLLLVARRDSATDRALGLALPHAPRLDAGRRRARIVPLESDQDLAAALAPVLDALGQVPTEGPATSSITASAVTDEVSPIRASA